MNYLYSLLFIAFTACGSSEPVPPALSAYVNAQEALADDDFDFFAAPLPSTATLASSSSPGTVKTLKSLLPLSLPLLVVSEGGVEKGRLKASMGVVALARPPP